MSSLFSPPLHESIENNDLNRPHEMSARKTRITRSNRPTTFSLFMLLICEMDGFLAGDSVSSSHRKGEKWQHCEFLTSGRVWFHSLFFHKQLFKQVQRMPQAHAHLIHHDFTLNKSKMFFVAFSAFRGN